MRVVLFFDQLQAGQGGKHDKSTPLGVEKGGIGSYGMFAPCLKEINAQVLATIYCGSEFFKQQKEVCFEKINKLLKKIQAEVVLLGPCFDFDDYALMSAELAHYIQKEGTCKVLVMCSEKCQEAVRLYKNEIVMIKMPKKGGVGLNESFKQMAKIMSVHYEGKDLGPFKEQLH